MAPSKTIVSLSFLAISSLLPLVEGLGCYSNGGLFGVHFKFGHLHSHPTLFSDYPTRDIISEVYNDIDTHCQKVSGATVAPGKQWTDCSDWAYTDRDPSCEISCQSDCGNESDVGKCIRDCYDTKCPIVPQSSLLLNRINWEIQHDGNGDETRTLSYDTCKAGFKNVLENCKDYGGELNHEGFWFKLDPNNLRCDQAF